LREAIADAIKLNPQTVSTEELLESVRLSTLQTKASLLPSGQAFCSSGMSGSETDPRVGDNQRARSLSHACGVSASVTIYDGGAGRARYRAAQASEAATRAAFNTADSLIPNTRGSLAYNTMQTFLSVSIIRGEIEYRKSLLAVLNTFAKFSTDANLMSVISVEKNQLSDLIAGEETAVEDFRFFVTLAPAKELETLDATIAAMKVPASAQDAIDLALSTGPGVLRRNAEVEMATWNLKALKAGLGPTVSLNASVARGAYDDRFDRNNGSKYRNTSIGITASIPLNFGNRYGVQSAKKSLDAKKSEHQAAIQSARHSISTTYQKLQNAKSSYLSLSQAYKDQLAVIKGIVDKIESGNTSGLEIASMITAANLLSGNYSRLIYKQEAIIQHLFSIQQVTGLLFENELPETPLRK
ncbi:MAG: TolC family protein, partial [Bdellovibrionota bacterium]